MTTESIRTIEKRINVISKTLRKRNSNLRLKMISDFFKDRLKYYIR